MILYPNAKINIGLDVLKKRNDGFHELDTVMHPIGLTDILTINLASNSKSRLNFTTTGLVIDGNPEDNLIYKAYEIIAKKHKLPSIDIHLHKTIPFGAGLGGGSADCSFAIVGINALCKLNLGISEMEYLAGELGSDCPFFIQNRPVIASGRGEKLSLIDMDLSEYSIVVVVPPIPISTKQAYSMVRPALPNSMLKNNVMQNISTWNTTVKNDFEPSVFAIHPEIEEIKNALYKNNAIYASLSGSGSAVFGIFKQKPLLNKIFPEDYFIWVK